MTGMPFGSGAMIALALVIGNPKSACSPSIGAPASIPRAEHASARRDEFALAVPNSQLAPIKIDSDSESDRPN